MVKKMGLESKIEELQQRQKDKAQMAEARRVRVEEAGGRGVA